MIQAGNTYVHGTAAEKLEYNVYEENKVLKDKKQHRANKKVKSKYVVAVLIGFALCTFIMYRYAMITELNYKIDKTNKLYNQIRNENSRLKVDIDKKMDLQTVKELAENRLGMQKPDKYQVTPVKVPKNDFTMVAEEYQKTNKSQNNALSAILDRVSEFTRLLY